MSPRDLPVAWKLLEHRPTRRALLALAVALFAATIVLPDRPREVADELLSLAVIAFVGLFVPRFSRWAGLPWAVAVAGAAAQVGYAIAGTPTPRAIELATLVALLCVVALCFIGLMRRRAARR